MIVCASIAAVLFAIFLIVVIVLHVKHPPMTNEERLRLLAEYPMMIDFLI